MIYRCILLLVFISIISCEKKEEVKIEDDGLPKPYIMVVGIAQDGGYPHIACNKECCSKKELSSTGSKLVSSLALVDPNSKKFWLFDASPDLPQQLRHINNSLGEDYQSDPAGIFLTHAHIGHYTGLMYLGREAMNSKDISVYAMPRMVNFLNAYGPWNQLVDLRNINLRSTFKDFPVSVNKRIKVIPISTPHRDEYSEMVSFRIETPSKSTLYVPDIDRWENWDYDLKKMIVELDQVFIDGTFFSPQELGNIDINEVPHPTIESTMEYLKDLSKEDKAKVYFIHFNHTNPAFKKGSPEQKAILENGFKIAKQFEVY